MEGILLKELGSRLALERNGEEATRYRGVLGLRSICFLRSAASSGEYFLERPMRFSDVISVVCELDDRFSLNTL